MEGGGGGRRGNKHGRTDVGRGWISISSKKWTRGVGEGKGEEVTQRKGPGRAVFEIPRPFHIPVPVLTVAVVVADKIYILF